MFSSNSKQSLYKSMKNKKSQQNGQQINFILKGFLKKKKLVLYICQLLDQPPILSIKYIFNEIVT